MVAQARVVVALSEMAAVERGVFTDGERAYASSKSDPERRLLARLAAKRAGAEALGGGIAPSDFEVQRGRGGPPRILLSPAAQRRVADLGGRSVLLSITHGREHAAAAVVVVGE